MNRRRSIPEGRSADVEQWRMAMSQAFVPLAVERARPSGFEATLRTGQVGDLMVATLRSTAQEIIRTPALISGSDAELWQIAVGRAGHMYLDQDDRRVRLGPGDVVVYETARPFHWSFDGSWCGTVFTLPRSAVSLSPAEARELTARPLAGSTGAGRLVSRFLRDLADDLGGLADARPRRIVTTLAELVIGLLRDSIDVESPPAGPREVLLLRIKDHIDRCLTDPDLTPATVASAMHVSARHLHALFADEPHSVAAYIRLRRLRRCARDLADPGSAGRTVARVATDNGFRDLRGFERAFKAEYGVTPGTYRRAAPGGP